MKRRPYQISDILDNLSEKQQQLIDLIIDVGRLPKNEPSVVIDTTLSTPQALRGQLHKDTPYTEFHSQSENETQELAMRLILKNWNKLKKRRFIICADCELGMGKTILPKELSIFEN
jgi:hypothetical protein